MNRFELFKILRQHIKLSNKRSLTYEMNKTAKTLIYIMSGFVIMYLLFIAILISLVANDSTTETPTEFLFGMLPFMLVADFLFRFLGQQTPAQLIKPYLLLPIPKYACVENFILSSMIAGNNLLWLCITVPYAIMCLLFSYGLMAAIGFVVGFQLIIIINSQNYMLWRTLIVRNILWWIAPIAVYALLFLPWMVKNFDYMFSLYGSIGNGVASWSVLTFAAIIAIIAAFFFINRKIQYHYTIIDTSNEKNTKLKTVSEFRQLDRFGEVGEYLKLEIKSIMRNKNMRNSFLYSTIFTVFLSAMISYTDVYDDSFSSKFFIVYVFIINGGMLLVKVMGAEGNYIDCLLTHKENILQLLHAKYYFYTILLLLPFIIMLPTVFMGKYSLLMLISMMMFAAGPIFCTFMQMAVWNKQTIPLNSKLVSKGNVETNWFAVGAEMAAMFLPVVFLSILGLFFNDTITYSIMLVIGVIFIAARNIWMRNIYQRFMARRYENTESYRATR
ncbi:MAG: hypothetical protein IJ604_02090 [Prevotella sp.]|nr:hypothetical protein [Prevotella sp.]